MASQGPRATAGAGVRIDLHCHTSRFSSCSALTPAALVSAAAAAGLEGICLTEHDRLWPAADLRALGERHGIVVLGGAEVTTELGHVLVYGITALPPTTFVARSLVAAVRAEGGLCVLAHPARAGQPALDADLCSSLFDAVEVLNGSDGPQQNGAAVATAAWTWLPGVAGSDCHTAAEVGAVATVLPHAVTTEADLVSALRLGLHTVVRLRPAR